MKVYRSGPLLLVAIVGLYALVSILFFVAITCITVGILRKDYTMVGAGGGFFSFIATLLLLPTINLSKFKVVLTDEYISATKTHPKWLEYYETSEMKLSFFRFGKKTEKILFSEVLSFEVKRESLRVMRTYEQFVFLKFKLKNETEKVIDIHPAGDFKVNEIINILKEKFENKVNN